MTQILTPVLAVAVTVWGAYLAWYDWKYREVPWWAVWPLIFVEVALFAYHGKWAAVALFAIIMAWDTDAPWHKGQDMIPTPLALLLQAACLAWPFVQGDMDQLAVVLVWGLAHLFWRFGFIGGGDAQMWMAIQGMFPNMTMTGVTAATMLAVSVPWILWKYRNKLVLLPQLVAMTAAEGVNSPDVEPMIFMYSLASAVYAWGRVAGWW